MTTEEIITIQELLEDSYMKAHELYKELCLKPRQEIDHPDSIAFRQAKDNLIKINNAFVSFSNHEWN